MNLSKWGKSIAGAVSGTSGGYFIAEGVARVLAPVGPLEPFVLGIYLVIGGAVIVTLSASYIISVLQG